MSKLVLLAVVFASITARADVLSEAARRQNLRQYIAGREDLSGEERIAWDKAVRLVFGGKALNDGTDEAVTVAKSVVSAAIFHRIAPDVGARAAYAAYYDSHRWVPPPIAINYQVLGFLGKKPPATARQMTLDFPRYFNPDIAPELAAWWDDKLSRGEIPDYEVEDTRRMLHATRLLMRPQLLEHLWQGAELEALARRGGQRGREAARDLAALAVELRAYEGVGRAAAVREGELAYSARYLALARELGERPRREPEGEQESPSTSTTMTTTRRMTPAPPLGTEPVHVGRHYGQSLARAASSWYGTPYLWGGEDRRGIDCSAYVREVFRHGVRVELPRTTRSQIMRGERVGQSQLQAGDLVFFDTLDRGTVTHVALYLGDGKLAHASSSKGVTEADLSKRYYQRAYWGSRRIVQP